ncbi:MAG: alpha/beta hydrolase [Myxococcota bacterium]
MNRVWLAILILACGGCEIENTLLFRTDKTDAYEFPDNRIPVDQFAEVSIETSDGVTLAGALAEHDSTARTALFLHGQGGNIDEFWDQVMVIWEQGFQVLIIDYRGYGKSEGEPSELGLYEDGRSSFAWLLEQGIAPESIVVWGHSLGTAVASQLATEVDAGALLLDAPFTSMTDIVERGTPFGLPRDWVIETEWDTLERITRIRSPLLVVHGTDDGIVPFWMGERVFDAAPQPKRFFRAEDSGHSRAVLDHIDDIVAQLRLVWP